MSMHSQRTFAGGEIDPAVQARADLVKYATGLRILRNMIVMRHGGIQNRAGTKYVGALHKDSDRGRLIPFVVDANTAYLLELGNLYMRLVQNGAQVAWDSYSISGASKANPGVITAVAHGVSPGDEFTISGVLGMTELNGRTYIAGAVGANTVALKDLQGNNVNTSSFGTYASGGVIGKLAVAASPYAEAELAELHYAQSTQSMIVTHRDHPPSEIAPNSLGANPMSFLPDQYAPNFDSWSGSGGSVTQRYVITAINGKTGEESLAGIEDAFTVTAVTQAVPGNVTISSGVILEGEEIQIFPINGGVPIGPLIGRRVVARNVAGGGTTFDIYSVDGEPIDTTSFVFTSGQIRKLCKEVTAAAASPSTPVNISWFAAVFASDYVIYKESSDGTFGFIGTTKGLSFRDIGVAPDTSDTPPKYAEPFFDAGNYPATAAFLQQSLMMASTDNNPDRAWKTRLGSLYSFSGHTPKQADDPVIFTVVGSQVNEIRHILDLGKAVILTSAGEYAAEGGVGNIITPTDINIKQFTYNGTASIRPLVVDSNAIYVQSRGSIVRDLSFEWETQGYRGNDLTAFAAHLFEGFTIIDWAYQQTPHSVVWVVRSDGAVIALTYVREQQIWGWHRHDFGGFVESVATIPENGEDAVYFLIRRTIDGNVVRYIERMANRTVTSSEDGVFMDSSLSYDGRNTNAAHTMILSGGTTWEKTETLTLTSSASFFTAAEVGNAIDFELADGTILRFSINAYTNGTVVTGRAMFTVPVELRSTASANWARAVDEVYGLFHLEGENVSILGNGYVIANPNRPTMGVKSVLNGKVSLPRPFSVVHVGLPYLSDVETLDIDSDANEGVSGQSFLVNKVVAHVKDSRPFLAGTRAPADDSVDPTEGLFDVKPPHPEQMGGVPELFTDKVEIPVGGSYDQNGRVFLRQVDPLPVSILSITPRGMFPSAQGG